MSALLGLRDYQTQGVEDLEARWDAGATRVPLVLATGLGKTVMFAHVIARFTSTTTAKRALVLVHTDELVQQAAKKIKDVAPHLSVGIVKAELNQVSARVIVASVQTLRNAKRRAQLRNVGLIIVDECHHATATTYRTILQHFGALPSGCSKCQGTGAGDAQGRCWDCQETGLYNGGELAPGIRVAGFTATLARSDKAKLSDVWEACTFQRGISFGIRRGYLLDVRGISVVVPDLDLTKVKKSGGDYQDGALEQELDRSLAPSIVASAYAKHAAERKAIGFAPTVASAEHFAQAFTQAGIPTAVIHGKLGQLERRLILKRLASGDVRVVWNCAVLTEGFDDPTLSCIIMARPTQSTPLYQQCIGRGLRPNLELPPAERGDCLVLDVVGASRNHSLRSLIDLSERTIREEIADDGALSLIEMEDQEKKLQDEETETAEQWYEGETESIDFDPLGRTTIGAWLQSDNGTYFLPCGRDAYVLIVPGEEPGTHDVAWLTVSPRMFRHSECKGMAIYFTDSRVCGCGQGHSGAPGGVTEHTGLSLEMAVSWGEEVMEEMGGTMLGSTKKRWRREPPSEAQCRKARYEGIVVPTGEDGEVTVSKGELSDMINERVGSRRIDPVVAFMMKLREGEK